MSLNQKRWNQIAFKGEMITFNNYKYHEEDVRNAIFELKRKVIGNKKESSDSETALLRAEMIKAIYDVFGDELVR